jgi:hypothetical protein
MNIGLCVIINITCLVIFYLGLDKFLSLKQNVPKISFVTEIFEFKAERS